MGKELITEDIKAALREAFKELRDDVLIEVYTKIGINEMFNGLAVDLIWCDNGVSNRYFDA